MGRPTQVEDRGRSGSACWSQPLGLPLPSARLNYVMVLQPFLGVRIARIGLLIALLGAIVWAASEGIAIAQRAARLPIDALFDGHSLPAPSGLQAFVAEQAQRIAEREVYLQADRDLIPKTLSELGIDLDVERTMEQARQAPRLTSLSDRVRRVLTGPPREPASIAPIFTFDAHRARRSLDQLAPSVHRASIDASLDLDHHQNIAEAPGRELDIETSLILLEYGARDEDALIPLKFRNLGPKIFARDLPPIDVSRVLAQFQTSFVKRGGARAINIRRGAKLLDGHILDAGATFSFNRVVGPRTEQRGFVSAPVIVHDEIDQGPGGGICQVATTVHASALYAGLEMIERRSHSRPSGYAPLGLDATVIDGKVDLRFRNPYSTPLMIHAFLPTRSSIQVEILGRSPEDKIEHQAQVIKRFPFLRRVVEKAELPSGDFKRSQKGSYGYDIVSIVRLTHPDGSLSTRSYRSNYYPVPEVMWVGPGTPAASLPPLPEGAEGLEPEPSEAP